MRIFLIHTSTQEDAQHLDTSSEEKKNIQDSSLTLSPLPSYPLTPPTPSPPTLLPTPPCRGRHSCKASTTTADMSITDSAGTRGGLPHAPRLKLRAAAGGKGERGEALGSGYDLWGFVTADKQIGILGKHAPCEVECWGGI